MTDLKPCPFCGGEAELFTPDWAKSHLTGAYCYACHATCGTFDENDAVVIAAWNENAYEAELDALRARVAELEAAQRWIPVTERLPEENRLVQVYNGSVTCGILREPQIIGGGWMIAFDYSGVLEFQFPVTHWMPLPQPPEKEK